MHVSVDAVRPSCALSAVFSRICRRIEDDNCIDLSAQTSFYFVLSMFPFCLIFAGLVGWLPSQTMGNGFAAWVVTYLPTESRQLVFSTILDLARYSTGFLSLGLLTAMGSASSGFVSLMEPLSIAYGTKDWRPLWWKHAIAILFTILAAVFALANFGLTACGQWGFEILPKPFRMWSGSRVVGDAGRWIITLALLRIGVDLLNFLLPVLKRRWRWLTRGTVFVALGFASWFALFNLYFQHFSGHPKLYGTLGGFLILMLWIYLPSLILLVGAEADNEIEKLATEAGTE